MKTSLPTSLMALLVGWVVLLGSTLALYMKSRHLHENRALHRAGVLQFSVPKVAPVAMGVTDSVRYQLDTAEGLAEFANLLPMRGHVVFVDNPEPYGLLKAQPKKYTVTMFHQLKCLDIIRTDLQAGRRYPPSTPTVLTQHCMNYLRQTILCRPNLRLESAKTGGGAATRTYDAVCRDWMVLYEEAERNQKAYMERINTFSNVSSNS